MARQWTANDVLETSRAFQPASVLMAAAELCLFDSLSRRPMTARELAEQLSGDLRAVTILVDALAAMELLKKEAEQYSLAPGVAEVLTATGSQSVLAMVQHHANCLRSWARLAEVIKSGQPMERSPSIRGKEGDLESFIEAMNDICRSAAPELVKKIGPPTFTHLLDLGGGPGTWTIAFLEAMSDARATLFDKPDVIAIARKHIAAAGLEDRVALVGGDFEADATLPTGADMVWISAIIHMNSREENRQLYGKVYTAMAEGGQILIRDIVMEPSRTEPASGAMFAVNMLVHTPGGGTFTFDELCEDLRAAGFSDPEFLYRGPGMDSVVRAFKK